VAEVSRIKNFIQWMKFPANGEDRKSETVPLGKTGPSSLVVKVGKGACFRKILSLTMAEWQR